MDEERRGEELEQEQTVGGGRRGGFDHRICTAQIDVSTLYTQIEGLELLEKEVLAIRGFAVGQNILLF